MQSGDFRNSDQLISVSGREYRVRNFFVNFDSINRGHIGGCRGYWGMLSDAKFDGNQGLWLNTGGRDDVSIVVSDGLVEDFGRRFRINDQEDLAGAYVLFIGELRVSRNGKAYMACDDLQSITVNLVT